MLKSFLNRPRSTKLTIELVYDEDGVYNIDVDWDSRTLRPDLFASLLGNLNFGMLRKDIVSAIIQRGSKNGLLYEKREADLIINNMDVFDNKVKEFLSNNPGDENLLSEDEDFLDDEDPIISPTD